MTRYAPEFKESVLRKLNVPEPVEVAALSEETGVPAATLYLWKREAGAESRGRARFSSKEKFLAVLETASMNETELADWCRNRGLFVEEAREYAARIDSRIALIDGEGLAELMIDHNLGVGSVASYESKGVDSDYFAE
jgi:hypothetical protein